jgi:adenylate kinase
MKIIMLGAPGSGKGTQGGRISKKYGLPHISTGDIFRENIKAGTELGKKAKGYMDAGELVPDELVCDLVVDRVHQPDCEKGYILDGFPRTIPQAEALTEALKENGEAIDFAMEMYLSDEEIIERMAGRRVCKSCGAIYHITNIPSKVEGICDKCGAQLVIRADDEPETVKKRLVVYHEQTAPLVDYYEKQGVLVKIMGKKGLEPCWDDIVALLDAAQK